MLSLDISKNSQSLFKAGFESSVPDTILVVDEQGVITQANPAAQSLFQLKKNSFVGRPLQEFFSNLANSPHTWPHISSVSRVLYLKTQKFKIILRK